MKIISVEAIPVRLPLKTYVSDSWGIYHASNHGIVRITDESGKQGLGEIAFAWLGGAHGLCREVNDFWAERLVGLDSTDLSGVNAVLDALCVFSKKALLAKAGVEMAVWDLLGKELGMPVHALLGGRRRDEIVLTGGMRMADLDTMLEDAVLRVSEGYLELKLKVGLNEEKDLEAVRRIRSSIPDHIRLRADANMAWRDRKQAKRMMDALYDLGVFIVEQPLPAEDIAGHHWLRDNTKNLLLIDEGVWDTADARKYAQAEAADMLHVYVSEAGGLAGARGVFELAAAFGMDCTVGSMPEGVIGASASLHLAAAMGNLSVWPSDIRGHTGYAEDVTVAPLPVRGGKIWVPDGPGLGVEIDEEKLKRLRVDR